MDFFVREVHFDTILKDEKFRGFFDHFFQVKLKNYRQGVKRLYYNCLTECISEKSVGVQCAQNCEDMVYDFYIHITKVLEKTLEIYPICIENCYQGKEMIECIDDCTASTLETLNKIDLISEYQRVLNGKSPY